MNRSLLFELASGNFVNRREDALFLGPPGSGKSHMAQAIGQAVIQQGHRVLYRETHALLDELAEANLDGSRKEFIQERVRLTIEHAMTLLNNCLANRLCNVTLSGTRWTKEKHILPAIDKVAAGQLEEQTAIHLLVEAEVKVIERLAWVTKAGLLVASFQ